MNAGKTLFIENIPEDHPDWHPFWDDAKCIFMPVERVQKRYIVTCQEWADQPLIPKFGMNVCWTHEVFLVDGVQVSRIGETLSYAVDVLLRRVKPDAGTQTSPTDTGCNTTPDVPS